MCTYFNQLNLLPFIGLLFQRLWKLVILKHKNARPIRVFSPTTIPFKMYNYIYLQFCIAFIFWTFMHFNQKGANTKTCSNIIVCLFVVVVVAAVAVIVALLDLLISSIFVMLNEMSQCMRFPTMLYVRPAKPQISLRIRAVWSEPLLVAWVFYDYLATDWTPFGVSKLKRRLQRLVRVYTLQNVKLLGISCHGSNDISAHYWHSSLHYL